MPKQMTRTLTEPTDPHGLLTRGQQLRGLRAAMGMSMKDFAHVAGVSVETIRRIECDLRVQSAQERVILLALGMSAQTVFTQQPQPPLATNLFQPIIFDQPEVNVLIPLPARRLLAMGQWHQQQQEEFNCSKSTMAAAAGVTECQVRLFLALLTRLGLHTYVGQKCRYVSHGWGENTKLVASLLPVRTFICLAPADAKTGLTPTPAGLMEKLRAETSATAARRANWGGARPNSGGRRPGAGRPRKSPEQA